jgi:hypothetical protein
MDGCHRRAMPTYVETDDHVRVSAGVRMWRARSTGPSRARAARRCRSGRAPANWSLPGGARARPLSTPVSVCLHKCLSVYGARPWPAGLRKAPPPTGHLPARAPAGRTPTRPTPDPGPRPPARRLPPRQLGRPTGRRPPPPRAHQRASPLLALPPSLVTLARAHPCRVLAGAGPLVPITVRARRPNSPRPGPRAPPAGRLPACPPARLPACPPARLPACPPRAPPTAHSPTHTHRPRPAHNRACKRSRVRKSFRGRPTFAGRPRASRAAMCPGQLATALRHQAAARARPSRTANWRGPMEAGDPREPVVAGPPASPEKGVWPPSKRPALPDPLVGGVCQQI